MTNAQMMRRCRRSRAPGAVALAALSLASSSCGGGGEPAPMPPDPVPAVQPAAPADAPAEAPVPEAVPSGAVPPPAEIAEVAAAAEPPAGERLFLLVLDASGSMRGRIDKRPKIEIARDVMHDLVEGLPQDTEAGLFAYGHRDKDRCDDIELVVPLGPIDKKAFKDRVAALSPKGKTPLTEASKQAIELAAAQKRKATVVLVSDGLETCDASPCDMVKAAKAEGVDFVLHVVGFDVKGQDTSALRCAAEASGGRYLEAENAEQLSEALDLASAEVMPPTGELVVKPTNNGEPLRALVLARGVGLEVNRHREAYGRKGQPARLKLPAGEYKVKIDPTEERALETLERTVKVVAGETIELPVEYGAGTLRLTLTHNGEPWEVQLFRMTLAGADRYSASESQLRKGKQGPGVYELRLGAGHYDVKLGNRDIFKLAANTLSFDIRPGETTELRHDFKTGTVSLELHKGGELAAGVAEITRDGKRISTTTVLKRKTDYALEPGRYTFEVGPHRSPKQRFEVTIAGGETIEKKLEF